MEKKLVKLYVPAVQKEFDLLLPADMEIVALVGLVADGLQELCEDRFVPSRQELLLLREPDRLLDPARTLSDYGVEDGARMALF